MSTPEAALTPSVLRARAFKQHASNLGGATTHESFQILYRDSLRFALLLDDRDSALEKLGEICFARIEKQDPTQAIYKDCLDGAFECFSKISKESKCYASIQKKIDMLTYEISKLQSKSGQNSAASTPRIEAPGGPSQHTTVFNPELMTALISPWILPASSLLTIPTTSTSGSAGSAAIALSTHSKENHEPIQVVLAASQKTKNPLFALAQKKFSEKELMEALQLPGADLNEEDPCTENTAAKLLFTRFQSFSGGILFNKTFLITLLKLGAKPNDKWQIEGGQLLHHALCEVENRDPFDGQKLAVVIPPLNLQPIPSNISPSAAMQNIQANSASANQSVTTSSKQSAANHNQSITTDASAPPAVAQQALQSNMPSSPLLMQYSAMQQFLHNKPNNPLFELVKKEQLSRREVLEVLKLPGADLNELDPTNGYTVARYLYNHFKKLNPHDINAHRKFMVTLFNLKAIPWLPTEQIKWTFQENGKIVCKVVLSEAKNLSSTPCKK
jgi:hypothetical protein